MSSRAKPLRFPGYSASVNELYALGFSRKRLSRDDVVRVTRGIVLNPLAAARDSPGGRCAALLPVLSQGQFFSQRTALALYGLPVSVPERIEIGSPEPKPAPRRPEIDGHRVRAGLVMVREVKGLPVAAPADAWCLTARVATLEELVQYGDALLSGVWLRDHKTGPLLTLAELAHAVERFAGTRGSPLRRSALPLVRANVDSFAETSLRLLLLEHGFPEPMIQCPVPTVHRTYRADLGYPKLKIAIEYDGAYHFQGGVEQARRDVERWEEMTAAGWRVLRVTARDLRDPASFTHRLREALGSTHAIW